MPLAPGTRLGPYEITDPIGKGGMGEVYRARDTKLGRDVAIKVLPEELASDEERVARFEREAKLLASLNHPNIAAIYGLESPQPERSAERSGVAEREVVGVGPHDTNRCALVLELVEGPTLEDRIAQGPIPIEEVVTIAKQIAEALEAGHEAGVIHRDLKPANEASMPRSISARPSSISRATAPSSIWRDRCRNHAARSRGSRETGRRAPSRSKRISTTNQGFPRTARGLP